MSIGEKLQHLREALAEETKRRADVERQAAENAKRRSMLEAAIEENQRSQQKFQELVEQSQRQLSSAGPDHRGHPLVHRVGVFIATCGYLGYVPIAPGTFGSALGLAVFAAVRYTGSTVVELAVIAAVLAIGIWSGTVAEERSLT